MEFNSVRGNLLLEVITDLTRKTYDDYADTDDIKEKIAQYIFLIKNYKTDKSLLNSKDLEKLATLHEFFYRTRFNEDKPSQGTINKTPLIDTFKSKFKDVEDLLQETEGIGAELLQITTELLNIYYDKTQNKDNVVIRYIDELLIPNIDKVKKLSTGLQLTTDNFKDSSNKIKFDIVKNKEEPSQTQKGIANKAEQKSSTSQDLNQQGTAPGQQAPGTTQQGTPVTPVTPVTPGTTQQATPVTAPGQQATGTTQQGTTQQGTPGTSQPQVPVTAPATATTPVTAPVTATTPVTAPATTKTKVIKGIVLPGKKTSILSGIKDKIDNPDEINIPAKIDIPDNIKEIINYINFLEKSEEYISDLFLQFNVSILEKNSDEYKKYIPVLSTLLELIYYNGKDIFKEKYSKININDDNLFKQLEFYINDIKNVFSQKYLTTRAYIIKRYIYYNLLNYLEYNNYNINNYNHLNQDLFEKNNDYESLIIKYKKYKKLFYKLKILISNNKPFDFFDDKEKDFDYEPYKQQKKIIKILNGDISIDDLSIYKLNTDNKGNIADISYLTNDKKYNIEYRKIFKINNYTDLNKYNEHLTYLFNYLINIKDKSIKDDDKKRFNLCISFINEIFNNKLSNINDINLVISDYKTFDNEDKEKKTLKNHKKIFINYKSIHSDNEIDTFEYFCKNYSDINNTDKEINKYILKLLDLNTNIFSDDILDKIEIKTNLDKLFDSKNKRIITNYHIYYLFTKALYKIKDNDIIKKFIDNELNKIKPFKEHFIGDNQKYDLMNRLCLDLIEDNEKVFLYIFRENIINYLSYDTLFYKIFNTLINKYNENKEYLIHIYNIFKYIGYKNKFDYNKAITINNNIDRFIQIYIDNNHQLTKECLNKLLLNGILDETFKAINSKKYIPYCNNKYSYFDIPKIPYKEEENLPQQINKKGGYKEMTLISLNETFILYYNCLISIEIDNDIKSAGTFANIYKLYFLLNIYGYYYISNPEKIKVINDLKDIINKNEFISTKLIIQDLIGGIYNDVSEIYEKEYLRVFNEMDCLIKNYYLDNKQLITYLHYNLIYPFYKAIEVANININLSINNISMNIFKSYQDIISEINDFFKSNELIMFPHIAININRDSCYKKDIYEFMRIVYKFTELISKNQTIIIDNMNDLNAYIVMKLLSSSSNEIEIIIRTKSYKILNIKSHPYLFVKNFDKAKVRITLSDIQYKLYDNILRRENIRLLLGILAKEYYFINFDVSKIYKFKFYLNHEILKFLNKDTNKSMALIDFTNLSIINYNNYEISTNNYSQIDDIISILGINGDILDLPLIINYTIFFISSLFISENNYKNFITLIYLYFAIRTNNRAYLSIINYKGTNKIFNNYKEYLIKVNFLTFLEEIIMMMRTQLKTIEKLDEKGFTKLFINFKDNKFINEIKKKFKLVINIDNVLKFYRINKDISNINIDDINIKLLCSAELIFENCVNPNKNNRLIYNNLIKLRNYFFIPLLKHISKSSNLKLRNFEIKLLDLDAIEILDKIPITIKGGTGQENGTEKPQMPNQINIPEFVPSNSLDNPKDIIDDLEDFNKFLNKFDKLSITALVAEYQLKLVKLLYINDKTIKDNSKDETISYFITTPNYPFPTIDKKEDKDIMPEITQLLTIVNNNKRKIEEELQLYTNADPKKQSDKQREFTDIRELYYKMKEKLSSKLLKYKNSNNEIIKGFLADFYPPPEDYEKRSLMEQIEDYLNKYESKFKIYIDILKDADGTYKVFIESLKDIKKNYETHLANKNKFVYATGVMPQLPDKRDSGGSYYGGNPSEDKKLEALKKDNDKIQRLLDLNNIKIKDKNNNDIVINEALEKIKNNLNKVKRNYKKIRASSIITDSANKDKALEGFFDNNGDNLFERMLYQYDKDAYESNAEIAKGNFYDNVEMNHLDPKEELAINFYDKLTFAFIVIGIRLGSLYLSYQLIDKNIITSIKQVVYYYTIAYVCILFILVFIVNIDVFRLRIIFNYLNLHSNSSGILIQFVIAIIIGYIVYFLIINLNTNEKPPTTLSKNQKLKLKYKIDILSIIMLIFIVLLVLII